MSILIKGMEMPTKCEECEWSTTDRSGFFGCRLTGNIVIRKREKDRPDWCPIVPVPEHGRLIDADAFKKRMMQGAIDAREDALTDEIWLHILDAAKSLCLDIDEQPTIIPAEEGEG